MCGTEMGFYIFNSQYNAQEIVKVGINKSVQSEICLLCGVFMGWVGCLCCYGNHGGTDLSCWTPASTGVQPEEDIGGEGLTRKSHAAITDLPPSLL